MQYAAGLGNLSDTEKTAALAEYDAAQKSAASAQSGSTTQKTGLTSVLGGGMGGPGMHQKKSSSATSGNAETAQSPAQGGVAALAAAVQKSLWYLDSQGKLAVRIVGAGSTDGTNTEIIGSDDLEGAKVILREKTGK
jgi:hypothetical protein